MALKAETGGQRRRRVASTAATEGGGARIAIRHVRDRRRDDGYGRVDCENEGVGEEGRGEEGRSVGRADE